MSILQRHKKKIIALGVVVFGTCAAHLAAVASSRMTPPQIGTTALPAGAPVDGAGGIRRLGANYTQNVEGVREVFLTGSPEEIGSAHARLLRDAMIADENEVWGDFSKFVPVSLARTLMMDVGRVRYRHVDAGVPEPRRRELAAQAAAFQPDPFADHMPTYERMMFLHSLYDIALSFEHSPLMGCSAFGLGPTRTKDGHALMARAFDFEAGEMYDRDKAVYLVAEDGKIPFASVAWPGMIGVLSGMNLEGVSVVVNGGRAREPRVTGEPVIFTLRDVLQNAHDTNEAIAILSKQEVMVSHIVFVGDASGHFAVVERAPGAATFVRENKDDSRVGITNHFEGPLASDPKNLTVEDKTTTLPRRAKLDEMLSSVDEKQADVSSVVAMLRDHTCAASVGHCDIGDRRAIDPFIATHGIVADDTARVLWVSAGPHLSGKFVSFDLKKIFAADHNPSDDNAAPTIDIDPALNDGRMVEGEKRAGGPKFGGDKP